MLVEHGPDCQSWFVAVMFEVLERAARAAGLSSTVFLAHADQQGMIFVEYSDFGGKVRLHVAL